MRVSLPNQEILEQSITRIILSYREGLLDGSELFGMFDQCAPIPSITTSHDGFPDTAVTALKRSVFVGPQIQGAGTSQLRSRGAGSVTTGFPYNSKWLSAVSREGLIPKTCASPRRGATPSTPASTLRCGRVPERWSSDWCM